MCGGQSSQALVLDSSLAGIRGNTLAPHPVRHWLLSNCLLKGRTPAAITDPVVMPCPNLTPEAELWIILPPLLALNWGEGQRWRPEDDWGLRALEALADDPRLSSCCPHWVAHSHL